MAARSPVATTNARSPSGHSDPGALPAVKETEDEASTRQLASSADVEVKTGGASLAAADEHARAGTPAAAGFAEPDGATATVHRAPSGSASDDGGDFAHSRPALGKRVLSMPPRSLRSRSDRFAALGVSARTPGAGGGMRERRSPLRRGMSERSALSATLGAGGLVTHPHPALTSAGVKGEDLFLLRPNKPPQRKDQKGRPAVPAAAPVGHVAAAGGVSGGSGAGSVAGSTMVTRRHVLFDGSATAGGASERDARFGSRPRLGSAMSTDTGDAKGAPGTGVGPGAAAEGLYVETDPEAGSVYNGQAHWMDSDGVAAFAKEVAKPNYIPRARFLCETKVVELSYLRYSMIFEGVNDEGERTGPGGALTLPLWRSKFNGRIRMMMCLTMYAEAPDELKKTLYGVAANIDTIVSEGLLDWDQIVVVLVTDGLDRANDATLDFMESINMYDSDIADYGATKWGLNKSDASVHCYESTVQLAKEDDVNVYHYPMQTIFFAKQRNAGKLDSQRWCFYALCDNLMPLLKRETTSTLQLGDADVEMLYLEDAAQSLWARAAQSGDSKMQCAAGKLDERAACAEPILSGTAVWLSTEEVDGGALTLHPHCFHRIQKLQRNQERERRRTSAHARGSSNASAALATAAAEAADAAGRGGDGDGAEDTDAIKVTITPARPAIPSATSLRGTAKKRPAYVSRAVASGDGVPRRKTPTPGLENDSQPEYFLQLIDVGTRPLEGSIVKLYKTMLANPKVAGCCGEIEAEELGLLNPVVAAQSFEYKISHVMDKAMESVFGYITVLPGAFSAYRYNAIRRDQLAPDPDDPNVQHLQSTGPLVEYFKSLSPSPDVQTPFAQNMYLAEDRILCFALVAMKGHDYTLRYVKDAVAQTDVPGDLVGLIKQRRRWLNGAFFAMLYAIGRFPLVWTQSRHSLARKMGLTLQFFYFVINLVLNWTLLGSFYLTYILVLRAALDASLAPERTLEYALTFLYLLVTTAQFLVALGNKPGEVKLVYTMSSLLYGGMTIAALLMGLVSALSSSIEVPFHVQVVAWSTLGSVAVCALLHGELHNVLPVMLHYVALIPTFVNVMTIFSLCNIHDVSWGTKGLETVNHGGDTGAGAGRTSRRKQKEAAKRAKEEARRAQAERDRTEASYKQFRSYTVMAMLSCNWLYVTGTLGFDNTQNYIAAMAFAVTYILGMRTLGSVVYIVVDWARRLRAWVGCPRPVRRGARIIEKRALCCCVHPRTEDEVNRSMGVPLEHRDCCLHPKLGCLEALRCVCCRMPENKGRPTEWMAVEKRRLSETELSQARALGHVVSLATLADDAESADDDAGGNVAALGEGGIASEEVREAFVTLSAFVENEREALRRYEREKGAWERRAGFKEATVEALSKALAAIESHPEAATLTGSGAAAVSPANGDAAAVAAAAKSAIA